MSSLVLSYLKKLQDVPSSPFYPNSPVRFLKNFLDDHQIPYQENDYQIIVNKPLKSAPKLVFLTHLDHPGMGLKNSHQGILFGSVGYDRLKSFLPFPIKIFNHQGEFVGKGQVTKLPKTPFFEYQTKVKVEKNFTAQYDFPYYTQSNKEVHVYNADNAIDTAAMLALLETNLESKYDLYYVFNFHEEVHQVSAWHLAANNLLNLNSSDLIITLESPIIENASPQYAPLNYEDGVVLKLSNLDCVFGDRFENSRNLGENIFRYISKKHKIPLQIGLAKGSDESRTFSHFKITPNIVTLAVPNRFKHNWGKEDKISPEMIYEKDVADFFKLLTILVQTDPSNAQKDKESLALKAKHDTITNKTKMRDKFLLNTRLEIATTHIIKRGYFFPINLIDHLQDLFYKSISVLRYLQLRFFS